MDRLKKVAIVGPESTGKTTLSKQLATHFETQWVPEFAREYLENLGGSYTAEDVEQIAREQIKLEDEYAQQTQNLLICDTNLLVIKIWMEHAYKTLPDWIAEEIAARAYDLHLLTDVDLPWEPDPLREHPHMRDYFFEKYRSDLEALNVPFIIISGNLNERLEQATVAVRQLFNT